VISKPQEKLARALEKLGIEVVPNFRGGLVGHSDKGAPLEVDLWLPGYQIAIEVNGIYWHSSGAPKRDRDWVINHQIKKTKAAWSQGIKLIHYFEDEINEKFPQVMRHLRSLTGLEDSRVYARNCKVAAVPWAAAKEFLNTNHLQGASRASPSLGLFHSGEMVAVMQVGKPVSTRHRTCTNEFELIRYATDRSVVGGASKLLSAYRRDLPKGSTIISYSDNRISHGNLYRVLGFTHTKTVPPDYCYVYNGRRMHKSHFTRSKLKGLLPEFDDNLTEEANCFNHRIFRLYNCGLKRWELTV